MQECSPRAGWPPSSESSTTDPAFDQGLIFTVILQKGKASCHSCPRFFVPIDEKSPSCFGEPLYFGKVLREDAKPATTAWINDPLSFVVCDGAVLYKWELGNINKA